MTADAYGAGSVGEGSGLGVGVGISVGVGVSAAVGEAVAVGVGGAGVGSGGGDDGSGGGGVGLSVGGAIVGSGAGRGASVGAPVASVMIESDVFDGLGEPRRLGGGVVVGVPVGRGVGEPARTSPAAVLVASATRPGDRSQPAPIDTLAARRMTAAAPTITRGLPSSMTGSGMGARRGGIDPAPASMARIDSYAATDRMQSAQLAACTARSRGGSPSAPPASQRPNRS
jgi:hypothetical protein